jgi:glycosyltransferase involved in cell wall biosynthesis
MDNYGGIERILIAISSYYHLRGVTVSILCFRCRFNIQKYADHPLHVVQLSNSRNPFTRARALERYLKQAYATSGTLPLLFGIKSAFYMGICCKSPFALHYTDPPSLLSGRKLPGIVGAIRRWGADYFTSRGVSRCNVFIAMTRRIADELEMLYSRKAEIVFPGGKNQTSSAEIKKRKNAASSLRVFSVCRLEPSKRIDWIINAVKQYNASIETCKAVAVIAGTGSEEIRLRTTYSGSPDVEILGSLSEAELEERWSRADLFAVPAIQGYGMPALEALYRAIPTVVHSDSGVSEVLLKEQLAIVVYGEQAAYENALADAINKVRENAFPQTPTTELPTETGSVREFAELCGWPVATNRPEK